MATEKVIRGPGPDVPVAGIGVEHEMTNFAATCPDSQSDACGFAVGRYSAYIVSAVPERCSTVLRCKLPA